MNQTDFVRETHEFDFCVVGGGMAGVCAAIAAARRGAKTALVQDRSVLGGNASSEVRMHICGAHGKYNRESGILEEIMLENYYRNPSLNYPIWDTVLYEKVRYQDNLTLFLNTSCNNLEMDGDEIASIRCWQLSSQKWITIKATYFADCSGDGECDFQLQTSRYLDDGSTYCGDGMAYPAGLFNFLGTNTWATMYQIFDSNGEVEWE